MKLAPVRVFSCKHPLSLSSQQAWQPVMVYCVSIHRCRLSNISVIYPALSFQELVHADGIDWKASDIALWLEKVVRNRV